MGGSRAWVPDDGGGNTPGGAESLWVACEDAHDACPAAIPPPKRRRMRMLIISQYYLPQPLANAEVIGGLAEGLSDLGHKVQLVTPVGGAPEHAGVTVRRQIGFYSRNRRSPLMRVLEYGTFTVGAAHGGMRGPRPDVIIVPSPPPTLGMVGALVSALRRVPLIYVVQDLYPEVAVATGAVRPGTLLRMLRAAMRIVYRRSAAVVAIDESIVPAIQQVSPGARVEVIRNGIDLRPFAGAARDDDWLRGIGADPQKVVVMYAGNVGRSQDLVAVAEATRGAGTELVIHGGGAELAQLRSVGAVRGWDHVHFSEYVDREKLGRVYASGDLHVVPLKPDIASASVPSKLLSIFAAGRPAIVVAESNTAAARLITESGGGWSIPPGSPAAIGRAIREACDRPEELAARGDRALTWALANAGSERAAAEYVGVMTTVVGHGPRRG